ncbi:hypothetical protein PCANC_08815 [Puccinia coronata f. sp. avenae]|uniref:Uncharacterized protein n=1 Tax=Puccinia coronata f. sp. avenae TaxID=200324 RepID=A0A2N5V6P1_9BASI|nr:hypothetical protein PCASD_18767 [Puccinia coronata f. sp. avenae]PLW45661.1 hypothetical protein PCASD_07080 [Puccinia coronata f. sp. avenae]PLW46182.1 hypothetical protein PCANC_08815 [Puccinia coronata f. sp. avenae]
MQLAAIPLPFIFLTFHLVEAIQQSGCANFFQLAPLPLCDGTSQIPGISSGGISSGGISSGGISSGGSSSGGFGSGGFGSGGFGSGGFSSGGFGSGAPTAKAPTATVGKLPARRLRFRRNHQSNATDINNVFAAKTADNLIFKTTQPSQVVAGGKGICGNYKTDVDLGVCLWSGIDETGEDPNKSGWVSGSATTNCKREVEVWKAATPDKKITARVLDGCGLNAKAFKVGCENLFLTKKLLEVLDPKATGEISDLKWNL